MSFTLTTLVQVIISLSCYAIAALLWNYGSRMTPEQGDTFLYFAFGSNLSSERIRINNPSARFKSIAKLADHQLDFNYFSKRWKGAAATVLDVQNSHVWGVLWELNMEHLNTLDKQEGVPKVYNRKEVQVELEDGSMLPAYTYFLIKPLEEDRRPSKVYLDVILKGAKEHSLPQNYIDKLQEIEHNGYDGEVQLGLNLEKKS